MITLAEELNPVKEPYYNVIQRFYKIQYPDDSVVADWVKTIQPTD
jgi:hypothetical protein